MDLSHFLLLCATLVFGFWIGYRWSAQRSPHESEQTQAGFEEFKVQFLAEQEQQAAAFNSKLEQFAASFNTQLATGFAEQEKQDAAVLVLLEKLGKELEAARQGFAEKIEQQAQTLQGFEEQLQNLAEIQKELTLSSQLVPVETVYEDSDQTRILVASDELAAQAYADYRSALGSTPEVRDAFDTAPVWEAEVDDGPAVITEKHGYSMADTDIPFDYDSWNT